MARRTTAVKLLQEALSAREIPSLYGIRGLAAMAVVLTHVDLGSGIGIGLGGYAVTCFFVLSGFLITHLLLVEQARAGTVSLRQFYIRRTLRIFPAFFIFCGVWLVGRYITGKSVDWSAYIATVTYTSNWYMGTYGIGTTMAHTWSLATEEQFYLLWPALFLLTRDHRKLSHGLVAVIGLVWIYRTICLIAAHTRWEYVYFSFETRCDALAIGCLMAVTVHAGTLPGWVLGRWVSMAAALSLVWMRLYSSAPWFNYIGSPLAFAVLILNSVAHHQSDGFAWLNSRPIRWLGLVSYSVYLYHFFADDLVGVWAGWLRMPLEIIVAVALGASSYYCIERPFLWLRDRRKVQRSSVAAV